MKQEIEKIIYDQFHLEVEVELGRPDPKFGDFATNVAMQLAGRLKQNPRQIADSIVAKLAELPEVSKAEVAGAGFVNIFLTNQSLIDLMNKTWTPIRNQQISVIETNNPNPFKAMHIGHAMNAVVADTIANLLEASGSETHRVSYHGDIGLHVGKSMYSLLKFADGDVSKILNIEPAKRNKFISKMYADGSKAYKESDQAKQEINQLAKESFGNQSEIYHQIYQTCKDWSFEEIDQTMQKLGNQPIEKRFLESQSDPIGVKTVKQNSPQVFELSDGAYIFRGSKYGSFDNVFVGSNGNGLYAARDLGLMELKNQAFHPDKSYIVTGAEQAQYFKGVIAAAGLISDAMKNQTVNIPTGLVKLSTGKMSSRDGDVITVDWLFDEFKRAIKERGGLPNDEIVAGALRYQFLKVKIGSDIIFDINDAVSLSGNTGSYLQYAHARATRVLEKSQFNPGEVVEIFEEDKSLVQKLGEFSEVVNVANRLLEPHHICNYLFELAQVFNHYYEKNRVIGSEQEQNRINLVNQYKKTLADGLKILGISAPSQM